MAHETGPHHAPIDALTEEEVSAYLREHPDFLSRHEELLATLVPPKAPQANGVIDFQYMLLEKLRGEIGKLQEQQQVLIDTSRSNMNQQARIHAAVLALLGAHSFEHFIQILTTDIALLLGVDMAAVLIEGDGALASAVRHTGVRVVEPGLVEGWLGRKNVLLLSETDDDLDLFENAGDLVCSAALIRLDIGKYAPRAMLAFGSRDPETFQSGQRTELVSFLAHVVERCIHAWLDLPDD